MDEFYELLPIYIEKEIKDFNEYPSIHDFIFECDRIFYVFKEFEQAFLLFIQRKFKGEVLKAIKNEKFQCYKDFKIFLLDIYRSPGTIRDIFGKLSECFQQNNESVSSFSARILKYKRQILNIALCENKLTDSFKNSIDEHLTRYFINGLTSEISSQLIHEGFTNVYHAAQSARQYEKINQYKNDHSQNELRNEFHYYNIPNAWLQTNKIVATASTSNQTEVLKSKDCEINELHVPEKFGSKDQIISEDNSSTNIEYNELNSNNDNTEGSHNNVVQFEPMNNADKTDTFFDNNNNDFEICSISASDTEKVEKYETKSDINTTINDYKPSSILDSRRPFRIFGVNHMKILNISKNNYKIKREKIYSKLIVNKFRNNDINNNIHYELEKLISKQKLSLNLNKLMKENKSISYDQKIYFRDISLPIKSKLEMSSASCSLEYNSIYAELNPTLNLMPILVY